MQVSPLYDVAILGGGPAGAATALALKRRDARLRVALVERTGYAAIRVGETLPPPVQRLLIALGVWDAFLRRAPLASYGTRAAWGGADLYDREFIFSPYGRGWHVDRRDFDALLAGEAERAGADVFRDTVGHARERRAGEWHVTLQRSGAAASDLRARVIVDATGRRSAFAIARGARHLVADRLVGATVFLRSDSKEAADASADTYTCVEACRDGWWYTAMVPGGVMAASFMTDAAILRTLSWRTPERWRALASSALHTTRRLAGWRAIDAPSLYPAGSQRLDRCAGDGWLAVGDAASTFDPLSSLGVMKALRSGSNASRAICLTLAGHAHALAAYDAAAAREYHAYLEGRTAYYAMEQRWPDSPFWRSRHDAPPARDEGETADGHVEDQHQEEPGGAATRDVCV